MKKTIRFFAFFLTITFLTACLSAADLWMTDYPAALQKASKENKLILLDFTGSDWCPWCIKLDQELFSQKTFKDYAEKNLVLVLVDFPRGKKAAEQSETLRKQNQALQGNEQTDKELHKKYPAYNVNGYPTLVLLDPQGKELKRSNYLAGGPEAFIKWVGNNSSKVNNP